LGGALLTELGDFMADIIQHPALMDPHAIERRGDFELVPDPLDPMERAILSFAVASAALKSVRRGTRELRGRIGAMKA
jgi:hypothetical protein